MLSGTIGSLIWILILIAIVAAVVAVIRRSGERSRSTTVVEQPQPVVRQAAPASGGLAPGWYPDQNDPSLMRYYDGRVWTAQTQPHA
jgi:Protein of unknown function (DUF2510)